MIRAIAKQQEDITEWESTLLNGITIYGTPEARKKLTAGLNEILELWIDKGQVNISEEDWTSIPLLDDWQGKCKPGSAKGYSVGLKDKAIIDEDFNKLQKQGRMAWSSEPTCFSFPCFVVWKTNPDGSKKW